jgi:hypothetical protein
MPRGGKRQGTPGKAYSNRTDLAADPNMDINTAGTGGQRSALVEPAQGGGGPPMQAPRSPDDTPMLADPSQRPNEPLTSGMNAGPGVGTDALGIPSYSEMRNNDIQNLKRMLPEFEAATKFDGSPETFKALVNYLKRL